MALRNIVTVGDSVLSKPCRPVTKFDRRLHILLDDMADTLAEANGVGLAAPQVGILKRIVVVDVTGEDPILLINPVILETSGEQTGYEGCLSVPGKTGTVTRPNYVKVKAYDENMEPFEIEGTELLARALCHEIDHLDGHLWMPNLMKGDYASIVEEANGNRALEITRKLENATKSPSKFVIVFDKAYTGKVDISFNVKIIILNNIFNCAVG